MATESQTGLDGKTRALDRMTQERGSPGRDTAGGYATKPNVETPLRRKDVASDQPATVVTPPDGN